MEIIDSHCHIWPEKVAQKAKEYLEKAFNHKMIDLPVADNLLKYMDDGAISKSVISSVASRPDQVISINNWLFSIRNDRFIPFASMHPFFYEFAGSGALAEEMKRIKDNACGIKLQPEFQNFYVDDEKAFPLYEKLQKFNLPVIFHCGIELSSPGEIKSSPERIIKLLDKFPEMKVIGAHMGGFMIWEKAFETLAGKNIYFDTSDSIRVMKKELLDKFFEKHGFDKIIYGSDFPMQFPKEEVEFIKNLNISEENKQKILGVNVSAIITR
ncbi:MAG: amidohydrolase family protein [Endomicrobium sp.]|jgi:predicted TIM-barrel fold metal-dependent hydrolase|nr:amidohydrolase family protein [Endomicrobium sp.]